MTNVEAIIKEVEKFNNSIIEALNTKNISDTQEAARSIYVKHGKNFVQSIGIFYIEFLDTGRGPGKFPPLAPIENWVESKLGIDFEDSDFDGIVYTIRRKIAEMGTNIFQNNNEGLQLDKKIVTLREAIVKVLTENTAALIKKKLNRFKLASLKNKYNI
jgi:hypothetical protein